MDNIEIKKVYEDDHLFCCPECSKQYTYDDVADLKYKYYCPQCQHHGEQNEKKNFKKILDEQNRKKEEKKVNFQQIPEQKKNDPSEYSCDNDLCIYNNNECKMYSIGCYDFCKDCFYAIGHYAAKNGI